ncbi:MAG: hypothetical protein QOG37_1313, partial [Mycobacterium sp.]|nr:hypothetical protein [Mycobacterium sp.]
MLQRGRCQRSDPRFNLTKGPVNSTSRVAVDSRTDGAQQERRSPNIWRKGPHFI